MVYLTLILFIVWLILSMYLAVVKPDFFKLLFFYNTPQGLFQDWVLITVIMVFPVVQFGALLYVAAAYLHNEFLSS